MALPRVLVTLAADDAVLPDDSDAARPAGEQPGSAGARPAGGPAGAVLRVVLEDVGMMDVAALDLGRVVLPVPGPGADELEVTLAVPVRLLQTGSRYSLRAHLDRDGSGEVAAGDGLTTVSVPVQAADVTAGRRVEVPLTQL